LVAAAAATAAVKAAAEMGGTRDTIVGGNR
jgi:hypothetical protein